MLVAIATGFAPTVMPFVPGVSGSESSGPVMSPLTNALDGFVSQRTMLTVPGSESSTNPYHCTIASCAALPGSTSWPGGTGAGCDESNACERKSQAVVGIADVITGCDGSDDPPPVTRSPP